MDNPPTKKTGIARTPTFVSAPHTRTRTCSDTRTHARTHASHALVAAAVAALGRELHKQLVQGFCVGALDELRLVLR